MYVKWRGAVSLPDGRVQRRERAIAAKTSVEFSHTFHLWFECDNACTEVEEYLRFGAHICTYVKAQIARSNELAIEQALLSKTPQLRTTEHMPCDPASTWVQSCCLSDGLNCINGEHQMRRVQRFVGGALAVNQFFAAA